MQESLSKVGDKIASVARTATRAIADSPSRVRNHSPKSDGAGEEGPAELDH